MIYFAPDLLYPSRIIFLEFGFFDKYLQQFHSKLILQILIYSAFIKNKK